MADNTTTAHLSDGRYVEVPYFAARDWAREAATLSTTLSLAEWYTQDDENEDEIQGEAEDFPRCDHREETTERVRVTNASQALAFDTSRQIASTLVCGERACILDALAWVERATGEHGVWVDDDGRAHVNPPMPGVVPTGSFPMDIEATRPHMDEEGYVHLTLELDLGDFLEAVSNTDVDGNFMIEDFVHDKVLSFGVTEDSCVEVLAVDGDRITIKYSTFIGDQLAENEEI